MRMVALTALLAWILSLSLLAVAPARAAADHSHELSIDLSEHEVAVAVDYAGADLVLFGATHGAGQVVVEVRGPLRREVVRRKARTVGIWLNSDEMVFDRVPAFYAVASSAPLDQMLPVVERQQEHIGTDNLWLLTEEKAPEGEVKAFRDALVRNKQRAQLFSTKPGEVRFLGDRLFRTDIHFPASAVVGSYRVKVFLVKKGKIVGATSTPLILSRVGFEARVFKLAHDNSLAYGLLATVIALVAGWLANVFFRSKA